MIARLAGFALSAMLAVQSHAQYTDQYDDMIKEASARFLPGHDWLWLKAQLIQESQLNPNAVSPVGAMGLGQIMPKTYAEVCKPLRICHLSPFNPKASILAAAYYQARMEKIWSSPRPPFDRKALGNVSYNAGAYYILEAQKLCKGALLYDDIIKCLHQVPRVKYEEPINYRRAIYRFYVKLKWGFS